MASQKNRRRSRKGRGGGAGTATRQPAQGAAIPKAATQQHAAAKAATPKAATPKATPKAATPRVAAQPRVNQTRRQQREQREREAALANKQASRRLGTYGEPPASIFGGLPVSEIGIFLGIVAVIVGFVTGNSDALSAGIVICALAVLEFSAREHFSGYRSHSTLLAAFPAVIVEVCLALFVGVPTKRTLLLAPVIPVFAFSFWLLQRAFRAARQARVARSPAP